MDKLTAQEIEGLRKQCRVREVTQGTGYGIPQLWVPTQTILALLSMLPAPVEPKELAGAVQILVRVQEVLRDNDLLYAAEGLRIPIGILLHARAPRLTEEQREAVKFAMQTLDMMSLAHGRGKSDAADRLRAAFAGELGEVEHG